MAWQGECGGTHTPSPAHPALARTVKLSAMGSSGQCKGVLGSAGMSWAMQEGAGQCRGVLADMGGAGTFCSGVGSLQCTVRVMSVVPSLQRGVINGDGAALALALEASGCGAVVGVSVQSYAQILPSGVKQVHLSHRQCPAAPVGGAARGGGQRPLPAAPFPLPTAAPAVPVVGQSCVEPAGRDGLEAGPTAVLLGPGRQQGGGEVLGVPGCPSLGRAGLGRSTDQRSASMC